MKYRVVAHRYADAIINNDPYLKTRYDEFINAIESITDEELRDKFELYKKLHNMRETSFKSLAPCINELIREKMEPLLKVSDTDIDHYWDKEVDIFNDTTGLLGGTEWRLDFACDDGFAVEVAFNHGEAIAWNLIKPCLASELNHVKKRIQTRLGIYVCPTDDLKHNGNIDSATGAFEKVERYLKPMMNLLVTPMVIIGLKAPDTFYIDSKKTIVEGRASKWFKEKRKKALIEYMDNNNIDYKKNSNITINGFTVSTFIKVEAKKVIVPKYINPRDKILFEENGWIIYTPESLCEDDFFENIKTAISG